MPPVPPQWLKLEEQDYPANAPARDLAHRAAAINHAQWPHIDLAHPDLRFMNLCRGLTNELADAALYQHLQKQDAAAIQTLRDLLALADSLASDQRYRMTTIVSLGIRAVAMDRLDTILSDIKLTSDPQDHTSLERATALTLMQTLLDSPDLASQVQAAFAAEHQNGDADPAANLASLILTAKRVQAEYGMAAIDIACHIYHHDHRQWPNTLADLHPLIPNIPLDPFGNGQQQLGFIVIKSVQPTGSDRPLVFSREFSKDGLFYRTDRPFFSYYPPDHRKQGGQFRDITTWLPTANAATTQPLVKESF